MVKEFVEVNFRTDVNTMAKNLGETKISGEDLYKALATSVQPMINGIRNNIPVHTGNLRESVGLIERNKGKSKGKDWANIMIGARTYGGYKGYHASLLEKGTDERIMTKGLRAGDITQKTMQPFAGKWWMKPEAGKSTGKITGRRWMQKGFDEHKEEVFKLSRTLLLELANTELKKKGLPTFDK